MCRDSVMARSLVDSERCESVKKRVYLPGVDEFRSSSGPLSEVVVESVGAVSSKSLKEGYVADITREGGMSPCSVILGLLYIHRLTETNNRYLRSMSGKDLFLTAMMIASKYLNDEGESEALTNSEWAQVGCKAKPVLDQMEREFLAAIDWKLYVSLEEYYSFVTGIEARIALNQFASRGWLTYTDMVTVWDAMDSQKALLSATKRVAKVTCGSAAVYLVLLSTIFTASHGIHSTLSTSSSPNLPSPSTSLATNTTSDSSVTTVSPLELIMMKEPPNLMPDILQNETKPALISGYYTFHHHLHDHNIENGQTQTLDSFTKPWIRIENIHRPPSITYHTPYHSDTHVPVHECKEHIHVANMPSKQHHSCYQMGLNCKRTEIMRYSTMCCDHRNKPTATADDDFAVDNKLLLWRGAHVNMGWASRMWSVLGRGTLPFETNHPYFWSHAHTNKLPAYGHYITSFWANWSNIIFTFFQELLLHSFLFDFSELFWSYNITDYNHLHHHTVMQDKVYHSIAAPNNLHHWDRSDMQWDGALFSIMGYDH